MFLNKPELGTTFAQLAGSKDTPADPKRKPGMVLSRRHFVMASSGLALGVVLAGCSSGQDNGAEDSAQAASGPSPLTDVAGGDATPGLWIEIEESGTVKITVHRSEMGQQVWTSMAQIVADELDADWKDVEIVQALGDPKYGDQNTDGSRSVRFNFHRLRVAGGAMRTMLEQAAADKWGVDVSEVQAELGYVVHNGEKLSYGELAKAASGRQVPAEDEIKLKPRETWRYIGKNVSSLTVEKIVRGEGTYGIDVQLEGMVHAVVARPPQIFGTTGSVDDSAAKAVPGVISTVRLPDLTPPAAFQPAGGVAVVASDTWAAIQGRNALEIEWKDGPNADHNSVAYDAQMMSTAQEDGTVHRSRGDVASALDTAATRISADYHVASLAHSAMEPPAATAKWTGDTLECWACVQDPQTTRATLAGLLDMDVEQITVHATWLGGAFGRKSKPDFVAEAAIIAKQIGKPVKVTWTREDDLGYDYFHAPSAQHFEGALDANGKVTGFLHRSVFPTISSTFSTDANEPSSGELDLGAIDTPFNVDSIQIEGGKAEAGLRIGWLRSVANVQHVFGVQSFAAELAHAAGRDQKDFLMELIGPDRIFDPADDGAEYSNYSGDINEYPIDTARLKAVGKKAATMANWGRTLPDGHGLGIAVHRSFLSYVATVIEVAVDAEGAISIPGTWVAVDAGTVVNPRHVKAQMEGGTLYGISNALFGAITATGGQVDQKNFPDWRLMRMEEAPRTFQVEIIASTAPPGGVGEPGTPPAAPALANAIFAATGMRVRSLPILGPKGRRLALDTAQAT